MSIYGPSVVSFSSYADASSLIHPSVSCISVKLQIAHFPYRWTVTSFLLFLADDVDLILAVYFYRNYNSFTLLIEPTHRAAFIQIPWKKMQHETHGRRAILFEYEIFSKSSLKPIRGKTKASFYCQKRKLFFWFIHFLERLL